MGCATIFTRDIRSSKFNKHLNWLLYFRDCVVVFSTIVVYFSSKEKSSISQRPHGRALKMGYRYTLDTLYQSVGIQTARNAKVGCSKCRETADRKRRKSNPSNGPLEFQVEPLLALFPDSWNYRHIHAGFLLRNSVARLHLAFASISKR